MLTDAMPEPSPLNIWKQLPRDLVEMIVDFAADMHAKKQLGDHDAYVARASIFACAVFERPIHGRHLYIWRRLPMDLVEMIVSFAAELLEEELDTSGQRGCLFFHAVLDRPLPECFLREQAGMREAEEAWLEECR